MAGGRHLVLYEGQRLIRAVRLRNGCGGKDNEPRKPSRGVVMSGGAISKVRPHTMVVPPRRTSAEDGAVEMDPGCDGLGRGTR